MADAVSSGLCFSFHLSLWGSEGKVHNKEREEERQEREWERQRRDKRKGREDWAPLHCSSLRSPPIARPRPVAWVKSPALPPSLQTGFSLVQGRE